MPFEKTTPKAPSHYTGACDAARVMFSHYNVVFVLPPLMRETTGLHAGKKADILIGDGPDVGCVCIQTGNDYAITHAHPRARSARVSLAKSHFNSLVPNLKGTVSCDHWVDGGKLFIRLPAECLVANEAAA